MNIVSTAPAQNSTNISLRLPISIVFDATIDTSTVSDISVVVSAKKTDVVRIEGGLEQPEGLFATDNFFGSEYTGLVQGKVTVSDKTLIFTPTLPLLAHTKYTVTVSDTIYDTNSPATHLDKLKVFTFTTAEADLMIETLPAVPATTSIIGTNVFPYTSGTAGSLFFVTSTTPKKDSFLIASTKIIIRFNKDFIPDDLSKVGVFSQELMSDEPETVVSASIVKVNSTIEITLASAMTDNTIIIVRIEDSFTAADNDKLNQEFVMSFVSRLTPYYSSTKFIRLKGGTVLSNTSDMNIALTIWQCSNDVDIILANQSFSETSKSILRKQYVLYMSLLSLLTNNFNFGLHDFIKKSLGDFNITVNNKTKIDLYNRMIRDANGFKRTFDGYMNFNGYKGVFRKSSNYGTDVGRLWNAGLQQPGLNQKYFNGETMTLSWDALYENLQTDD